MNRRIRALRDHALSLRFGTMLLLALAGQALDGSADSPGVEG